MTAFDPPDGRTVVERYLAGDSDLFAEGRRAAQLVVKTMGSGIPAPEREEIVQQVLFDVYMEFQKDGFQLRKGLACFVRKVAARGCLDYWRRRKNTVEIPSDLPDPRDGADRILLTNERDAEATEIMEGLPPSCRRIIEMRVVRHLPYAVIAAMTKRPEGALRFEMHNCVKKAQRLLEEIRSRRQAHKAGDAGRVANK